MGLGSVNSELSDPKRCVGSCGSNNEGAVLVAEVGQDGTKDVVTVPTQDVEVTAVPRATIRTAVAMAARLHWVWPRALTVDGDMGVQTAVASRALAAGRLEGAQPPKQ